MPYRIALIDNEPAFLSRLVHLVQQITKQQSFPCTVHCFTSSFAIDALTYDAYLLDIEMEGMDGIQLAQEIRRKGSQSSIIFISGIDERVFEALRVQPLRFIRKSHLKEELPEALSALRNKLDEDNKNRLTVTTNRETIHLPVSSILYIEGENKVQHIVTRDRRHIVYCTMSFFESELIPKGFFRIQRSYLVNMDAVICIQKGEAILRDGTHLPISREKYTAARKKLEEMIFR